MEESLCFFVEAVRDIWEVHTLLEMHEYGVHDGWQVGLALLSLICF